MPQNSLDLAGIFQAVTQALADNQQPLNQADEYNQDHGSNMVQTFQTITTALQKKQGSSDSAALNYAARQLSQKAASSSGKLYAQNLSQAASQFEGKTVDAQGALQLLQTLIGGQSGQTTSQSGGGDLLSGLLGSLTGGGTGTQQPSQSGGGDLLGSLLGGLTGGGGLAGQQPSQSGGGDLLGSLLSGLTGGGGSAVQQPSQSGGGDLLGSLLGGLTGGGGLQSLAQTFLGGSGMGNTTHRTQSTQVVVNAFLQALGSLSNKS